ncbi:hypothetical protein AURDEDRAFT_128822 [Auricularia subglabra TFB-10046 SS5]|nr:hypothetical protein AURDEDRAFT_128822 [Auricularia subglabra TFB-10046 SS5]
MLSLKPLQETMVCGGILMKHAHAALTLELETLTTKFNNGRGPLAKLVWYPPQKNKEGKRVRSPKIELDLYFCFAAALDQFLKDLRAKIKATTSTELVIKYTVPHKVPAETVLENEQDWEQLKGHLKAKGENSTNVHAKIIIRVPEDEENASGDDDGRGGKKQKANDIPEAELRITEKIRKLRIANKCSDASCDGDVCVVDPTTGAHNPCTFQMLSDWAEAWEGGEEGVDQKTPPNMKAFNTPAKHRRSGQRMSQAHGNTPNGGNNMPNIVINIPRRFQESSSSSPPRRRRSRSPVKDRTNQPAPSHTDMSLELFKAMYGLPDAVCDKLAAVKVDGPAALAPVLDEFIQMSNLELGERGKLLYAMAEWKGKRC